jgi:cation transport regulator ChaC
MLADGAARRSNITTTAAQLTHGSHAARASAITVAGLLGPAPPTVCVASAVTSAGEASDTVLEAGGEAARDPSSGRTAAHTHLGGGGHSAEAAVVHGTAYRLRPETRAATVAKLWHREKAGYSCLRVDVHCGDDVVRPAYTFAGTRENPYWVGHEEPAQLAAVIARSVGPSGSNIEYFEQLHAAMRARGVADPHLEDIARHLVQLRLTLAAGGEADVRQGAGDRREGTDGERARAP